MALILALIRLALSVVFGIAGTTKLLDRPGTREAVINFGAPKSLAPALAGALPIVEILIALGLLFDVSTWWSALAALLTLTVFMVAIAVNLAQGRTHDCHCFGQLHSRPLGWTTLFRNVLFAVMALSVLWRFEPNTSSTTYGTVIDAVAELNELEKALLVAAILAALGAMVVWQRRQKLAAVTVSDTPEGLPLNTPAPQFEIESYDGGQRSLSQLLEPGKPLLLLFTNPQCRPCVMLFQEIRDWQVLHGERLTIALISRGSIKDNFVSVAKNGLGEVLLQKKGEVAQLFGATLTPTAVVVSPEGRIASDLAAGSDEIRKLLESVLG